MSKIIEKILTPVGRLVWGSLYIPQKTDINGQPLFYKNGARKGEPRTDYVCGVAIEKKGEEHWSQTEWGAKILKVGQESFPQNFNTPSFAWKIIDGDSQVPNPLSKSPTKKPCDNEGYPGHWVIKFKSTMAPNIVNSDGTKQILEQNFINPGDYVQVYASVVGNNTPLNPGIHINHIHVAFSRYGKRIISNVDASEIGFGKSQLPTGASKIPIAQGFNPVSSGTIVPLTTGNVGNSVLQTTVPLTVGIPPHPAILTPKPVPPVSPQKPAREMLPAANGFSYEELIETGWTDELLIQHGMMRA